MLHSINLIVMYHLSPVAIYSYYCCYVLLLLLLSISTTSTSIPIDNTTCATACYCWLILHATIGLLLSYWVWEYLKTSSSTEINLSKPPLLLSLKISKILILFKEINMIFYAVFVQVLDSTLIQFTLIYSFGINIIDSADWYQHHWFRWLVSTSLIQILFRRCFTSFCNKLGMIDIYAPAWGSVRIMSCHISRYNVSHIYMWVSKYIASHVSIYYRKESKRREPIKLSHTLYIFLTNRKYQEFLHVLNRTNSQLKTGSSLDHTIYHGFGT